MKASTVSLFAIPIAMILNSCATMGSSDATKPGRLGAHVKLEQTRRFHTSFHKLDGKPLRDARAIRVSPGKHVAELKVRWQGAEDELVSFRGRVLWWKLLEHPSHR